VLVQGQGAMPGRLAVRRVTVHIDAEPSSPGRRWLANAAAALLRQGGF
jgi:hypothetical protein